jgi:lysophospholipase L1-like esterase
VRILKPLALVIVALVGVVGGLEVAFRLGGLTVRGEPLPAADGSTVILCIGDSHTRGLPDPDNYPAQLERILNERAAGRYRVVNVGVAGMNTAQIRSRLPRYLAYYRPALVMHWAGINNFWNLSERGLWRGGVLRALLDRSRVAHFLRVTFFYRRLRHETLDAPAPEVRNWPGPDPHSVVTFAGVEEEIRGEEGQLSVAEVETATAADLRAMMRMVRDGGIPMYLVTYSWWDGYWRSVNAAVRAVSAELGVPYVDGRTAVRAARAEAPGAQLFDAWVHPMPLVYRHVAEQAYRLLVDEEVVVPTP